MHREWSTRTVRLGFVAAILCVSIAACDGTTGPDPDDLVERFDLQALGSVPYPPDNPAVTERIELGRLLFYDPILSGEMDVACGTCHHPDFAFADGRQFSAGVSGTGLGPARTVSVSAISGDPIPLTPRNGPTVLNAAMNGDASGLPSHLGFQFWDGRALGLEEQARGPIASRREMAGDAYAPEDARDSVVARLRSIPEYVDRFAVAFPAEAAAAQGAEVISMDTYGRAVAAFERELTTRNSRYDRFVRGDGPLSELERLGLELFFTKGNCAACHAGPMFSDFDFHVVGVPQAGEGASVIPGDDTGREEHTLDPDDRYGFRTPSLRNVALTAPYMHDGIFETLDAVVLFYNLGARPRHAEIDDVTVDSLIPAPLGLTGHEMDAVVAFLETLTDPGVGLDPVLLTVPPSVPSGLAPVFGVK